MPKLVSRRFNTRIAEGFKDSFSDPSSAYYVCFGKHTPYAESDASIETPVDSLNYSMTLYDDMIYGKIVGQNDVELVVPRITWESNTIYSSYDDQVDLTGKKFYVATKDGSNYNVFKCLYSGDVPSTVTPTVVDTVQYTESDGYIWKYLYTITETQWKKFSTNQFMPVYSNTTVVEAATDRSIDVMKVEYQGSGYSNYFLGTISTGLQVVNSTTFRMPGEASPLNDFYRGCVVEFTTTTGVEYGEVIDYVGSTRTVTLGGALTNGLTVGDTYRVYPKVLVYGDGSQTKECLAWAIVDPASSNSISRVEVVAPGLGYRKVDAEVANDQSVGVTDRATVIPVVSPPGGHGFDPAQELVSSGVCISLDIDGNETSNLVVGNDFRNVVVLNHPLFRHVVLSYDSTMVSYELGETVLQYRPIQLVGTCLTTSGSNTVTGNGTHFSTSLSQGDRVLLEGPTVSVVSNVASVSSDETITLTDQATTELSQANVYVLDVSSTATVETYGSNTITLTDVTGPFYTGQSVVGTKSGVSITTTAVTNNSRNTNLFKTFQQSTRFVGVKSSIENFLEDEFVFQNGSYQDEKKRPTGRVYYFKDATTDELFITNERNRFSEGATLVGNTSGATFVATNKYPGDLVVDSGEVYYVNNVEAVAKGDDTSETVKVILHF